MEDGGVIEHGLLVKVRRNGGRPQFFHEREWSSEGNANCYETMAVLNSVVIYNWGPNVQVRDLHINIPIKRPYIKAPGVLEFSWPYMISVEMMNPETLKKTGYIIFYEKVDGRFISRIKEVKPDPDSSLRQRYRDLGFLRSITPTYARNLAETQA